MNERFMTYKFQALIELLLFVLLKKLLFDEKF
jgi:hypothetical protein